MRVFNGSGESEPPLFTNQAPDETLDCYCCGCYYCYILHNNIRDINEKSDIH